MGLSESSQECKISTTRFKSKGYIDFYHFGNVQICHDELTNQQYIKTSYEFILQADSQHQFLSKLKRNNNECPYLIHMLQIQTDKGNICSNTNTFNVYFQYLPTNLQGLLDKRSYPFAEMQVRLILTSLLEGVKFINQNQTYHGDIYPEFIYLDQKASRKYKIFDSAYFNPLKHGYYRALEQSSYCSPQIMANVSQRRTFPLYNHYVSDTFSIGMVCLYCMTLINPLSAYNSKSKEIDYYYIEMLIRIAKKYMFSEELVSCVAECVRLKNRPTVSQVLKQYPFFIVGGGIEGKISLRK